MASGRVSVFRGQDEESSGRRVGNESDSGERGTMNRKWEAPWRRGKTVPGDGTKAKRAEKRRSRSNRNRRHARLVRDSSRSGRTALAVHSPRAVPAVRTEARGKNVEGGPARGVAVPLLMQRRQCRGDSTGSWTPSMPCEVQRHPL